MDYNFENALRRTSVQVRRARSSHRVILSWERATVTNQDKPTNDGDQSDRPKLSLRRKILFSLLTCVLFFVVVEVLLRVAGIGIEQRIETMQFTFPIDDYNNNAPQPFLQRDEKLFWKPTANILDHNSNGFYGPEFSIEKPDGKFRIVCLGDSCTHFGPLSYPDILRAVLEKVAPGKFEVINAGVIGYTSFQGRTLLESQVLGWSPDLVTIYFGWNDHWLALGLEDKDQVSASSSAGAGLLAELRVFQLLRFMKQGATKRSDRNRVELPDYRDNLVAMHRMCSSAGIDAVLITAPHAFDLGIPDYLRTSGELSDPGQLIPMHQEYNQVVRDVAAEAEVELLDLATEMNGMQKSQLFIDDHIHLSQDGRAYLARRLMEKLSEMEILNRPAESSSE